MPSIEENLKSWDREYDWANRGDEWSRRWGGVYMQWHAMILTRIYPFIPAGHILEIAPGYGRWTQFLAPVCNKLTVVDLSSKCIDYCKVRFAALSHVEYLANDGLTLPGVADRSVDFCFSFGSLVHVELDVMQSYLRELARVLSTDGVAALHHSNFAMLPPDSPNHHARGTSVRAELIADYATSVGLACVGQELMNWGPDPNRLTDCFSVITRQGSKWDRPNKVWTNSAYRAYGEYVCKMADLYSAESFGK